MNSMNVRMNSMNGTRQRRRSPLALLAIATASVSAALSFPALACPAAAVIGKSLALSSPDGRSNALSWLDGSRVRLIEGSRAAPKSFPRDTLLLQGLLALETASPTAKSRTTYAPGVEAIFPLVPGKDHEIAYTSQVEGQPPLKARLLLAVPEALQHKIGDCTYEALLVVRMSEFENGQRTPVRYDVYVPALRAILKSTVFDETNNLIVEQESFEFETIAEK